ncbi:MAG: phosphoglycerate kinase [Firmicutes bacterium]|nr:phosphoglycerate kinase [Bacillota bacterium]
MAKKTLRNIQVAGKRVLVRVDFNVPLQDGQVADDTRIRAALPTIRFLRESGAKIILVSHLGRPKGKIVPELRLNPVAERLSELLETRVNKLDVSIGPEAQTAAASLNNGEVLLLENIRFYPGEEKNCPQLAHDLAQLAEVYINDAFGTAHRAHSSTVGVAAFLPAVAGLLLEQELKMLGDALNKPKRPFVAVLGGAKISDKIIVLENLTTTVDILIIGGGMAFTFLAAQGIEVGRSLLEKNKITVAARIMDLAQEHNVQLLLPQDVVVASEPANEVPAEVVAVDAIPTDQMGLDIGPRTAQQYARAISQAKTVFFNGPMGAFEYTPFAAGTKTVAQALADSAAISIVGGGDSAAAIAKFGLGAKITHISTGGGAALKFLEGKELPGLAALEDE